MPHIFGQLINAQLENSAGNPASGGTPLGRFFIDSTNPASGVAKYYNGSSYVVFGASLMTPNSTAAVAFNSSGNSETQYNTAGATIASLAITLPVVTTVGQICRYVTKGVCTVVVVTGTVSVGAALTTLAANGSVAWQAVDAAGTFVRLQ